MAYTVTITEVAANVAVNESSYPVTVSYDAVQLDGVNVSDADITVAGNLVLTLSDASTIDAGYVKGDTGATGPAGADGPAGDDGVSVTDASTSGGNLVLTLSDATTIDAGSLPVGNVDLGPLEANIANNASNITILQGNIGNLATVATTGQYSDLIGSPTNVSAFTNDSGYITDYTVTSADVTAHQGNITITESQISDLAHTTTLPYANITGTPDLSSYATITYVDNEIANVTVDLTGYATESYVGNAVANLVDSAPATLDTLNELASALGNDASFSTTVTTALGNRLRVDTNAQGLTSGQQANAVTNLGLATVATSGAYSDLSGTPTVVSAFTNDAGYITDGLSNVVEDTTPQLGGDLDVNSNAITGTSVNINGSNGDLMITATENGPVALRYDNNLKLSTKSDGVNITGELEADSLDIDGNADILGTLNTHTIPGGTGTFALTSDIPTTLPFANITATPTTLSGYGITDGYTNSDVDAHLNQSNPTDGYVLSWTSGDYAWVAQATGSTSNSFETISVNGTDVVADSSTDTLTLVAGTNITLTGNAVTDTITVSSEQTEVANSNRVIYTCVNKSGGALDKGTPVYAKDVAISGQTIAVDAADASDPAKMPAIGVLNEDLANDAEGDLLINGQIQGIDTQTPGFGRGDVIWVASGGGYTNTKPTGEGVLLQNLGTITKVDTTNGGGIVMGAGRSAATPNLNSGNIFLGNVGNAAVSTSLDTAVGDAGYIKTYTETNDLTSAVTWATVPDAYISSSSITQHQGNLSITESQISDLSHTTSLPFASITSTPTTVAGYGITDALSSTLAGNIDMNGYYLVDSSQTGTGTLTLSKAYTDPVANTTSYITAIDDADLHIVQDKATPNLVRLVNENTGTTATTEFRMGVGNITGSDIYDFGFMSMAGSGYAHPYLSNIDPGELFFSNFNGDVVIGTGTGFATNGSHRCKFKVKSALGDSIFGGAVSTGLPDFDALVVDENGDTTLGATLKLTDYEEKINTGLGTTGTLTPDPADGTVQKATLTGDITINALSNASAGQTVTLILTQPSSGNYTLTSTMLFAGGDKTLSTASDAVDIMTIFYDGSTYYASLSRGFA